MKLLQELLALPEQLLEAEMDDIKASDKPLELKEVITNFPKQYKKVFETFWGTPRLVYKGQSLFKGSGFGPAYNGAIKAAEKAFEKLKVEVEVDGPDESTEIKAGVDSSQECYLGYDLKTDKLHIGFDVWLDVEKPFNKWADKTFDEDNEEDQAMLDAQWKKVSSNVFYGVLFELDSSDGKNFSADEDIEKGGFYSGIYKQRSFKNLKLVDLRLD